MNTARLVALGEGAASDAGEDASRTFRAVSALLSPKGKALAVPSLPVPVADESDSFPLQDSAGILSALEKYVRPMVDYYSPMWTVSPTPSSEEIDVPNEVVASPQGLLPCIMGGAIEYLETATGLACEFSLIQASESAVFELTLGDYGRYPDPQILLMAVSRFLKDVSDRAKAEGKVPSLTVAYGKWMARTVGVARTNGVAPRLPEPSPSSPSKTT